MPISQDQAAELLSKYRNTLESFDFAGGRGATTIQKDLIVALTTIVEDPQATLMSQTLHTGQGGGFFYGLDRSNPQALLHGYIDSKYDSDVQSLLAALVMPSMSERDKITQNGNNPLEKGYFEIAQTSKKVFEHLRTDLKNIYASQLASVVDSSSSLNIQATTSVAECNVSL